MPYIKKDRREVLDMHIADLLDAEMPSELVMKDFGSGTTIPTFSDSPSLTDGDINYIITKLVAAHCFEPPFNPSFVPTYTDYQRAIGIVECAKLELYRKGAGPYEDTKELLNGGVLRGR